MILDSERTEELIEFPMMFFYVCNPKFYQKERSDLCMSNHFSSTKFYVFVTLRRSFFDILKSVRKKNSNTTDIKTTQIRFRHNMSIFL